MHKVEFTTFEYTTETFFIDEASAENYIKDIFMPYIYNPDLCYIISRGTATWTKSGILVADD